MIFSEESSRAVYRDGQHGVDRTETNPGDYSVFFLPEARTKGNEHVSMRRMGSTQSKYDGPNQSSSRSVEKSYYRTTVFLSRGRKSGHNQWQKDHQKKPWMQEEVQRKDTNTPLYWTDDRTTKYTGLLNWRTVGLGRGSSTSTTSPRLTSVMKHLTDSDYDMKAHSI